MHKNKVVKIIRSFSPAEVRQLDKFVRSPIHNQHEDVTRLFQYIRKHLTGGERALRRQNVFKYLFPDEEFDMQKVHHVSSYLLKVIEEFLAWKEWRKEKTEFGLQLMRAYSYHKLDMQFKNCHKKTLQAHLKQPLRDAQFYQQMYSLQFEEYNYARTLGRTREFNLQHLSDSQDTAFLVEKLKNACLLLSHQAVTKTTYDTRFLKVILKFLEGHQLLDTPAVSIYYHAYLALSDVKNEHSFDQLKNMLVTQKSAFQIGELRDLYILAINYCIRRLNSGNQAYLREVFDIYQAGLETNVFIDNGVLSPWTYNNIVQSGLKLREFQVVEDFILKYKDFLPENQRDNFFNFNFAWLHYGKKEYRTAMQLLLLMDISNDVLTACAVKTLSARMYYEQGEFETLNNHLQSFKVFIRRKKILAYHRELYMNFIQFLQNLAQQSWNGKRKDSALVDAIRHTKVVAAKEWLLEQVA